MPRAYQQRHMRISAVHYFSGIFLFIFNAQARFTRHLSADRPLDLGTQLSHTHRWDEEEDKMASQRKETFFVLFKSTGSTKRIADTCLRPHMILRLTALGNKTKQKEPWRTKQYKTKKKEIVNHPSLILHLILESWPLFPWFDTATEGISMWPLLTLFCISVWKTHIPHRFIHFLFRPN